MSPFVRYLSFVIAYLSFINRERLTYQSISLICQSLRFIYQSLSFIHRSQRKTNRATRVRRRNRKGRIGAQASGQKSKLQTGLGPWALGAGARVPGPWAPGPAYQNGDLCTSSPRVVDFDWRDLRALCNCFFFDQCSKLVCE